MFKFSDSPDLLRRFRSGERSALEQVYFAYIDEVERFTRKFLALAARSGPSCARVDAGDLVQDVFVRAFGDKARASFDASRDYGPYLGTLMRNVIVDWARRRGREVPSDHLDIVPELAESDAEDRETMAIVNQYIETLSKELRDVHEHRYVQCLSQQETCRALGISRQTVRTRESHLRCGLLRRLKRLELGAGPEDVTRSS